MKIALLLPFIFFAVLAQANPFYDQVRSSVDALNVASGLNWRLSQSPAGDFYVQIPGPYAPVRIDESQLLGLATVVHKMQLAQVPKTEISKALSFTNRSSTAIASTLSNDAYLYSFKKSGTNLEIIVQTRKDHIKIYDERIVIQTKRENRLLHLIDISAAREG